MPMDKLLAYLNSLGKEDRAQFVAACDTSEGYLRKAISIGQKLGLDLCILLAREAHGAFSCEDLRPDTDWAYLREFTAPIVKRNRANPTEQQSREATGIGMRVKPRVRQVTK